MIAQLITNGLLAGAAYSLIAIGYTMIYGVGKLINFAHGELYMGGAYCFYLFYIVLGWDIYSSCLVAMGTGALLGIVLERVVYRPFKKSSRLVPLITTIGASTFLKAMAMLLFGVETKSLLKGASFQQSFSVLGIIFTPVQGLTMVICLGLMLILGVTLKKTKIRHHSK